MSHKEGFAVRRVFGPPFLCETSFSRLGCEKKRATSSRRDFQEVVVQQLQTGGDGQVNMHGKRVHTLIVPVFLGAFIISAPPLPTLSPSNTLKCLFSFDVDGGSHAAAQIRDMMNTTELRVRGASPARPPARMPGWKVSFLKYFWMH